MGEQVISMKVLCLVRGFYEILNPTSFKLRGLSLTVVCMLGSTEKPEAVKRTPPFRRGLEFMNAAKMVDLFFSSRQDL